MSNRRSCASRLFATRIRIPFACSNTSQEIALTQPNGPAFHTPNATIDAPHIFSPSDVYAFAILRPPLRVNLQILRPIPKPLHQQTPS
jgi:hypothetical protein